MPLRVSPPIAAAFAIASIVLAALPAFALYPGDWPLFWAGGATAGTLALTDPHLHVAFQIAHGVASGPWTYPPAFAWAFVPVAALPIPAGYALNVAANCVLVGWSGWILAGVFGYDRRFGAAAALAWEPALFGAGVGQVGALWFALVSVAVWAAAQRRELPLGVAVGVLLLKPPLAIAFVAVLLVRRCWKACAIVAAAAVLWYVASVAAAAGDWQWPARYAITLHALVQTDSGALYNAISLPTLLLRAGVPALVALTLAALALLAALPALARADAAAATSATSLFALAVSPHAWMYDAVLVLPALFWTMRRAPEPQRTWIVTAAYILAAAWMPVVWFARFNPLAIVVLVGAALAATALYAAREAPIRARAR